MGHIMKHLELYYILRVYSGAYYGVHPITDLDYEVDFLP